MTGELQAHRTAAYAPLGRDGSPPKSLTDLDHWAYPPHEVVHTTKGIIVEKESDALVEQTKRPVGSVPAWFCILAIVGGLLVGVAAILGNHFFFSFLDGRRSDLYSQFWITTAKNIFPKVAQVFLALSMSCSLTQAIWYHVGRRSYTLPQLDLLFGLSNPLSLVHILFSRRVVFLLPPVIIQIVVESLALIPVFVPGTLTIENGISTSVVTRVPSLDFSTVFPSNAVNMNYFGSYLAPSTLFKETVRKAATSNVASLWSPPEGDCSSASRCSYTFNFTAPALRCTDLPSSAIGDGLGGGAGQPVSIILQNWEDETLDAVYNATSNLNRTNPTLELDWNDTYVYDLTVACIPHFGPDNPLAGKKGGLPGLPPVGSACIFWNATYSTTTTFTNDTQLTSTHIQSYHSPLSPSNCSVEACDFAWDGHDYLSPEANFAIASRAMAEAFVDLFIGTLTYYGHTGNFLSAGDTTSAQSTPLFSINNTLEFWSFDLTAPSGNLSQGLTNLFTNTTLAFMSIASNLTDPASPITPSTLAEMTFLPSYTQYHYVRGKLLLIYGVGVFLACAAAGYGLWCLQVDVHPGQANFSEIVAATRHRDVDLALVNGVDTKLRYGWESAESAGVRLADGKRRKAFMMDA